MKDNLFKIIDFSSWKPYEGFSEGSGRSEKQWLQASDGTIGLFKWPKIDPSTQQSTYEHVSEHLANQIGKIIGVKTARVDIGIYDGRIGSMSYCINQQTEELIEGVSFILGLHPNYDPDKLFDIDTGRYYCVDNIFEISEEEGLRHFWIDMMLFDFLIGNRDRHQSNWAFIMPVEDRKKSVIRVKPCPLYDNGSSLCCYVTDKQINQYLGKDKARFLSLVDTKSRSAIRIEGNSKKEPTHSDVIRFLVKHFPYASEAATNVLSRLNEDEIKALLDCYPSELLSSERKKLLFHFLYEKKKLLERIISEAAYE